MIDSMWLKHLNFRNTLICLAVAVGVLTFFAKQYPYFPVDLQVTSLIQSISGSLFAEVMVVISWIGYSPQSLVITGVISLLVGGWLGVRSGLFVLTSTAGAIIISILFKAFVGRIRPDATTYDSFPSGHVLFYMGLVGFLTYLIYLNLPKGILRSALIYGGFILILLSGVSRIYLGFHWFSDVMGAYLLGLLWLLVIVKIFKHARLHSQHSSLR